MSGTVERQAAHFFRITVTESDLKAGIIISCKSTGKDKFKTVFFDNQVIVTWCDVKCHLSLIRVAMVEE